MYQHVDMPTQNFHLDQKPLGGGDIFTRNAFLLLKKETISPIKFSLSQILLKVYSKNAI